jgi:hypothetical protein
LPWDEEIGNMLKSIEEYSKLNKDLQGFDIVSHVNKIVNETINKYTMRQPVIQAQIDVCLKQIDSKITMENLKTGFSKSVFLILIMRLLPLKRR